jgi:hypothetical protein
MELNIGRVDTNTTMGSSQLLMTSTSITSSNACKEGTLVMSLTKLNPAPMTPTRTSTAPLFSFTRINSIALARVRLTASKLKGKCALGPFLSILVIECQHKCLNVIHAHG